MTRLRLALGLALLLGLISLRIASGVHPAPSTHGSAPNETIGTGTGDALVCSQRNWRLAAPQDLDRVVIQASHILIRHAESQARQAPLVVADWNMLPPPPNRSSAEALARARAIREQLVRNPQAFSELAARYSDDPLTASEGGELGVLAASNLRIWPGILDALGRTAPGTVSDVVETPWGYHVFLKQSPPEETKISARRIVIGHADAPWLQFGEREDGPLRHWRERTFEEARDLATRLATELRASPERFDAVVQDASDHWDAAQGGDVGSWSNLEPNPHARALALVGRANVGEIVGPVNTFLGWVVWQRTRATPRPSFAMQALRFRYDPLRPSADPTSKVTVERQAREVLATLEREPQRFAELQRKWGEQPDRWAQGRGRRGVEHALNGLKVGEIGHDLIDADWAFLIARRLAPEEVPAPRTPTTELPFPDRVALEYYIGALTDESREDLLRHAVQACDFGHHLPDSVSVRFRAAIIGFKDELAGCIVDQDRLARSAGFLGTLRSLLGPNHFGCLRQELDYGLRPGLLR
ncbi:MAG TPA: peptidylprolyl isomerase [Polyangiaceae bacterium]|jgi:hypothetical protein|nr:peptidylprolyl isomerase [Polyangiaceae bacterium]